MQQVSEILVSETCCIGTLFAHLLIWKGKVGRSGGETTKAGRAKLYAKLNAEDIVAMEVNSLAFVMEKEMRMIGCTVVILDASQLSVIYASTKKTDKEDPLKLARLVKIYEKECLFSAAEIARLKNTAEFAYRQTSLIDVCAYRARIEQLPKFTLCSVVQF